MLYAGAQLTFQGLDQVNLQIDPSLRGQESVPIAVSVDGVAAKWLDRRDSIDMEPLRASDLLYWIARAGGS